MTQQLNELESAIRPRPIPFKSIDSRGDIAVRLLRNFSRLEGPEYEPRAVFRMDQNGWPGDWEGRTILALSVLAQATGRSPAYLDDIIELLPERLNRAGYFGPIRAPGVADEQQLSGHSWLVRGLVDYLKMRPCSKTQEVLENIVRTLFLPLQSNYANYPLDEETRYEDSAWVLSFHTDQNAAPAGSSKKANKHSDRGCAFIPLDGMTAALDFFDWPELDELCRTMINAFVKLPLADLCIQTHATLSGTRGLLRYYRRTNETRYLRDAQRIWDVYRSEAWTETYGNYNWFGLPFWTEPCAIVDSYMISIQLWSATGQARYLEDAHYIYYNALAFAFRENGAFGSDTCAGSHAHGPLLKVHTFDVFWCCNMRGGEGLARSLQYSVFGSEEAIIFPTLHSVNATVQIGDRSVGIRTRTEYPYEGNFSVTFDSSNQRGFFELRLFVSELHTLEGSLKVLRNGEAVDFSYEDSFVSVSGDWAPDDVLQFDWEIRSFVAERVCQNNTEADFSFRYGPLVLGLPLDKSEAGDRAAVASISRTSEMKPLGRGCLRVGDDLVLRPLYDKSNPTKAADGLQVAFKDVD